MAHSSDSAAPARRESDLYPAVKAWLEQLGYAPKGEICGCDVVALGPPDEPCVRVIVAELKQSFSLELALQGVDRAGAADEVWLAIAAARRGRGREHDPRVKKLCRLLGFGLLAVGPDDFVEPIVAPEAWKPRRDLKRRSRLMEEHRRRLGDPTRGGSTGRPILTAYRQRTLALARALAAGPARPRDLKSLAPDAAQILQRDVYGWFSRIERGVYGLGAAGRAALAAFAAQGQTPQDNSTIAGPTRATISADDSGAPAAGAAAGAAAADKA